MTGGNIQLSASIQQAQGQVQTQQAKAWGSQAQQSFSRALEKASGNDYSASKQNAYKGRDGGEMTHKAQDTRENAAATAKETYVEDTSVTYVRTVVERVEAYVQTTTVSGGADGEEATLGGVLGMLLASLQKQAEQDSQNEAAEMAAALMIALLAPNQDMAQEQLAQLLSGDISVLGQTGALGTLRSFFGDANMAKTFSGAIGDMASMLKGEMGLMEKAEGVSSMIASLRYTMVEVTAVQKSDLALTSGFQQSMQQLAKDLQSALGDMDDAALDIDALQSQVNSGAFLRSLNAFTVETPGAASNLMSQFDVQDVANQILQQMQEEAGLQRSEFEMTLTPESLGKITVKLVEEAGRMSLTITAANAQTQRLLTGSLAELRTAMAPFEVEIAQTEVTASEPSQQEQDIPWDQQDGRQQSQQQPQQEEQELSDEDFRRILAGTIGFGGGMQFTAL